MTAIAFVLLKSACQSVWLTTSKAPCNYIERLHSCSMTSVVLYCTEDGKKKRRGTIFTSHNPRSPFIYNHLIAFCVLITPACSSLQKKPPKAKSVRWADDMWEEASMKVNLYYISYLYFLIITPDWRMMRKKMNVGIHFTRTDFSQMAFHRFTSLIILLSFTVIYVI